MGHDLAKDISWQFVATMTRLQDTDMLSQPLENLFPSTNESNLNP